MRVDTVCTCLHFCLHFCLHLSALVCTCLHCLHFDASLDACMAKWVQNGRKHCYGRVKMLLRELEWTLAPFEKSLPYASLCFNL